jgi:hypothetical protein
VLDAALPFSPSGTDESGRHPAELARRFDSELNPVDLPFDRDRLRA